MARTPSKTAGVAPRTKTVIRLSAALAAFAVLALLASLPAAERVDERFTVWVQRAAPTLDGPASILVKFGNAEVVIPAVALVAALLLVWHRKAGIAALWLVGGLTIGSFVVLIPQHLLVHPGPPEQLERQAFAIPAITTPYTFSPRHDNRRVHPGRLARALRGGRHTIMAILSTPYSLPSGHTVRSTLLAGTILRTVPWAAAMFVLSMMAALVYLGGHWLSDVLAGVCLGWALIETGVLIRAARSRNDGQDWPRLHS